MWNPRWAQGRIPAGTKLKVICLSGMAIAWNAVSAPVVMIVAPEAIVTQGQRWAVVLLAYPAVGVVIIAWALYALMRHLKFGRGYLQLETLPGVIGGQLRGQLILAGDLTGLEDVDVSLRCINSVTTGSGKHRRTTRTTIWEEHQTSPATRTFEGVAVSVPAEFDIPLGASPTGVTGANSRVDWKLQAGAEVPGVNLKLEFDVPVFHVAAASTRSSPAAFENEVGPAIG
jgi:hypothetical protein